MSSAPRSTFSRPEGVVLEEDDRAGQPFYALAMAREVRRRVGPLARRLSRKVSTEMLLALGFGVAAEVEAVIKAAGQPGRLAVVALIGPTVGVSIALRRSRPLLAMLLLTVTAAGATVVQALLPAPGAGSADVLVPILALMVLSYSLGAHGSRRELAIGVIPPLPLIVLVDLLQPGSNSVAGALPFFAVFIVGAPVLAGRLVRGRHTMIGRLQEQERQIDAQRAAQIGAALALERLQLADRLHETLVAGMESLIAQVAVAQPSLGRRQAEAVAGIEATARSLLAETRNVVVSLASPRPVEGADQIPPPAVPWLPPARPLEGRKTAVLPWMAIAAAAVCVGLLVEIRATPNVRVPIPIALLGCFVIAVPLALAWSRPLLMATALYLSAALFSLFVAPLASTFTGIALSFLPPFTVAFLESRWRALAGLGICCLGELAAFGPGPLPGNAAFLVCAWIAGRVLEARSRMVDELRLNNAVLAEQRGASSRRAVLEERARVARELHDAIGHSLTVVALQAGAARRMWTSDREKAEAALDTIARVAAEGLAELRTGFGSSQFVADRGSTRTARRAGVEALLDGARGAGLSVRLQVEGDEPTLPADTELAVFRVLQEALTNVLRHAPGASADVTVRTRDSNLELVVSNSAGDQPSPHTRDRPHGLRGMRERVEACGGRLDWGDRPDGGFELRADFPTELVKA